MEWDPNSLWYALGWVLMTVGLIGSVIPVLPGPILVLAGAVMVAASEGFERIGWPTLAVLGVLTALAWGAELLITTALTRQAGAASWRTVGGAIVGGLAGGALLGAAFTAVGGVFGAAIGAVVGVVFVERVLNKQSWPDAWRVSRYYLAGCLIGRIAEFSLSVLMVVIVAAQFIGPALP